MLYRDR